MRKNEYCGPDFSIVTGCRTQKVLYFNPHFKLKMLWSWIHVLRVSKSHNVTHQTSAFWFCLLNFLLSKLEVNIICSPGFNFLFWISAYKLQTFFFPFWLTYFPLALSLFMLWYKSTYSFCCDSVIHHCPGNPLTTSSMTFAFVLSLNCLLPYCLFSPKCLRPKQTHLPNHLSDSNQCLSNLLSANCQVTAYLDK